MSNRPCSVATPDASIVCEAGAAQISCRGKAVIPARILAAPPARGIERPQREVWFGMAAAQKNVLGGDLQPCSFDPLTGFYRDGCCTAGPEDLGSHTVCAVVTAEFLDYQQQTGNDLVSPAPQYGFAGLVPGDRWCVSAFNWLRAYQAGAACFVVMAATNAAVLEIVPREALERHAVDVPPNLQGLEREGG